MQSYGRMTQTLEHSSFSGFGLSVTAEQQAQPHTTSTSLALHLMLLFAAGNQILLLFFFLFLLKIYVSVKITKFGFSAAAVCTSKKFNVINCIKNTIILKTYLGNDTNDTQLKALNIDY